MQVEKGVAGKYKAFEFSGEERFLLQIHYEDQLQDNINIKN